MRKGSQAAWWIGAACLLGAIGLAIGEPDPPVGAQPSSPLSASAHPVEPLEKAHLQPGARQVESRHQPIVAGTDDQRVKSLSHQAFRSGPAGPGRTRGVQAGRHRL